MKKRFISLVLAIMMIFTMMAEAFPNAAVAASSAKYATISSISNAKNGVSLKWNAVSGATKYAIYYKHGDSKWIQDSTTTDLAAVATHASESGETYYFKIKSYMKSTKKWVDGKQSSGIMFISAPEVTISGNTANGVTLKWDKITVAKGYRVYYKLSGADKYTKYKDVTSPAVTITGLTQWGKYVFAVRAYNGSTFSGHKATETLCVGSNPVVTAENTATGIKLTWDEVTGATKYRVYYKYGDTAYQRVKDVTDLTYTMTGLTDGTKYTFAVKAYNSTKKVWSSHKAVSLVRYSSVPVIRGTTSTTDGFEVSWTTATNATKYRLYYKEKGASSWIKTDVTAVTKTLTGLTYGKTYTFAVRAYNGTDKVWGAVSNFKSYKYTKPTNQWYSGETDDITTIKFDPEVIEKIMSGYKLLDSYSGSYCTYANSMERALATIKYVYNKNNNANIEIRDALQMLPNMTNSQLEEYGLWKDANGFYFKYDSDFYDTITDYKSKLDAGCVYLINSEYNGKAITKDNASSFISYLKGTGYDEYIIVVDSDEVFNLYYEVIDEIETEFKKYTSVFNVNGVQCESTMNCLSRFKSKTNWDQGYTNSVACSGHVFENIICSLPKTCTSGETYMCICTKCGYISEKGENAEGHDYSIFLGNYGVCCENGYWAKYQCSICGDTKSFCLAPVQNCQKVWSDNGHMACNVCTCSVCGTQYALRIGDGSEKDIIAATKKVVDLLNDYTYARIQKRIDNGDTVIEKDLGNGYKEWIVNYGTVNEVDYLQAVVDEEYIWAYCEHISAIVPDDCRKGIYNYSTEDLEPYTTFSDLPVLFRYWGAYDSKYNDFVYDHIPVYVGIWLTCQDSSYNKICLFTGEYPTTDSGSRNDHLDEIEEMWEEYQQRIS